ncbi:MAG: ferredoxin [Proteobacteria bacterium]|nr:ferredoxin [Pseudomonadota bacterium]
MTNTSVDLAKIFRFHVEASAPSGTADLLPALLGPFRDASRVRFAYPLFLGPEPPCLSLFDTLQEAAQAAFGDGDRGRILKDNLPRVERFVRQSLASGQVPAGELLAKAGESLATELGLDEANDGKLRDDYAAMMAHIAPNSQLLGYGPDAAHYLLIWAAQKQVSAARQTFRTHAEVLIRRLRDILKVDSHLSADMRGADALKGAMGKGEQFLNAGTLSNIIGKSRGSKPLDAERHQRIDTILKRLETWLATNEPILAVVHGEGEAAEWAKGLDVTAHGDPCAQAIVRFDEGAARLAKAIGAFHVGQLEVNNSFNAERHANLLNNYDWRAFSKEELQLLTPVIAIESGERLAGPGLAALSQLICSGRPIQVVVKVQPLNLSDEAFQLQLGYLGISFRQAFVQQSSAARPNHLQEGFLTALRGTRAGLHVLCAETDGTPLDPWLFAGAALEGRAHPFFRYDPEAGSSWAERLVFDGNPQPETDWPIHEMVEGAINGSGTCLPFTFADFAMLDPGLAGHYLVLDETPETVIPIVDWLGLGQGEALRHVPYVWAMNANNEMQKVAVSRAMAFACRDHLAFWQTLQELAGINNQYANAAAESARQAVLEEAEAEKAALVATHTEEIERIRNEEADEAMGRLTAVLLEQDLGALVAGPSTRAAPAATPAAPADAAAEAEPDAAPEPEAEEDDMAFDEPYIDSMLCTSCNDCLNLNSLLFVYDDNKQAVIGDVSAGTFEELVRAAEACPSRCIHPGAPQNAGESNLDALVERAKPFN